jgi:hypothetical protein
MGGVAVGCKNVASASILMYGWHGGSYVLIARPVRRMGGMVATCKIGISPSIFAYCWHGGSDVLIGPSILTYGCHCSRVKNCIIPSILAYGGTEVLMLLLLLPFWRTGGMAVACKNGICPSI